MMPSTSPNRKASMTNFVPVQNYTEFCQSKKHKIIDFEIYAAIYDTVYGHSLTWNLLVEGTIWPLYFSISVHSVPPSSSPSSVPTFSCYSLSIH